MIRNSVKPSRAEIIGGGIYLFFYRVVLPLLASLLLLIPGTGLDELRVNVLYFAVNFVAATIIFRKFLLQSLREVRGKVISILFAVLLGYLGSDVLSNLLNLLIYLINPEFFNVNDNTVNSLVMQNPQLMFLGAVILGPITEELLFRGLIFRSLYDRSPAAAHIASILVFSMIHVSGYVGMYDVGTLMLCFLQYIPISYCLNFTYVRSGSILAPMLLHIANNAMAMSLMR